VAELLGLGAPPTFYETEAWLDYTAMGIGECDIPDLISLATDPDLNWADGNHPRDWGPLHAWRALSQLRATEAVRPLVQLVRDYPDNDWVTQDLNQVFARMGPDALPPLKKILANPSRSDDERETVAEAIGRLGQRHPEARAACKDVARDRLGDFARQSEGLNAFLVAAMIDLRATEDIELIRRAYRAGAVDTMLCGDVEDVEIQLGLRTERDTPRGPLERLQEIRDRERAGGLDPVSTKVGRNQPCPCGSGKKYKRCCGAG
jgi:hypothetical protein